MPREAVVSIPGLNCTRRLYEPQISFLGDIDVFVADHTRDDTTEAIARRLLADAPERFSLVGLSMGGYVALEAWRQAPGRISRLALLDTNARPDPPENRPNRERLMEVARKGGMDEVHRALWPKLVHPDRQADDALEQVVRLMAQETGPEAFARQQRAIMTRRDSRPDLGAVSVPTLVLVGEQDLLTPLEQSREMAGLVENARFAIVPACGHLSTLERPEEVGRALAGWLPA